MTKSTHKYVVIEDELEVCRQIKNRMAPFENWECIGLIAAYEHALIVIQKQPELIFLDWSIRGGNAFDLLDQIKAIPNYSPYIIFFTGYQSDNPEIPEQIINHYRVNRYLVKPIWEKITAHLPQYVAHAEELIQSHSGSFYWIQTIDKVKLRIRPEEIICISQSRSNSRNKIIHYQGAEYEIRAAWEECEEIMRQFSIDYCVANGRDSMVNKRFIKRIQKPFIWLENNLKIEVTKERWRELEGKIS